jgi:D-glycero-alpha-D-manno-heptose-7-phosphate kinase
MIIVRSPLRITLGGGNSDCPAYYEKYGGFTVCAAIDKYVYVTVTRPFFKGIFLKYSQLERVDEVEEVQHPTIRAVLEMYAQDHPQVEITSLADIPAGTGLGSSGSFTTALIKALCVYYGHDIDTHLLADLACTVEMNQLHQPTGKQDQYIAAYGGLKSLTFSENGGVEVEPIRMPVGAIYDLEDRLLLFFTGIQRSAGDVLQDRRLGTTDHKVGIQACQLLEMGSLDLFGELLNRQAERKLDLVPPIVEEWRQLGLRNGAIGGKLVGAGGGGFLMFYTKEPGRVRSAMESVGLDEVRFRFAFEGTKVMVS